MSIQVSTVYWHLLRIRKQFNAHVSVEMLGLMHKESQDAENGIKLTPRGREVFRLIREGWSDQRIAGYLGISYSGVRRHREKMLLDNGCDSMLELVARYYAHAETSVAGQGGAHGS